LKKMESFRRKLSRIDKKEAEFRVQSDGFKKLKKVPLPLIMSAAKTENTFYVYVRGKTVLRKYSQDKRPKKFKTLTFILKLK